MWRSCRRKRTITENSPGLSSVCTTIPSTSTAAISGSFDLINRVPRNVARCAVWIVNAVTRKSFALPDCQAPSLGEPIRFAQRWDHRAKVQLTPVSDPTAQGTSYSSLPIVRPPTAAVRLFHLSLSPAANCDSGAANAKSVGHASFLDDRSDNPSQVQNRASDNLNPFWPVALPWQPPLLQPSLVRTGTTSVVKRTGASSARAVEFDRDEGVDMQVLSTGNSVASTEYGVRRYPIVMRLTTFTDRLTQQSPTARKQLP